MIEFKTPAIPSEASNANDWANYLTAFAIAANERIEAAKLTSKKASDIARDACALFVDRTSSANKGEIADGLMLECVRLAKLARSLVEKE